MNTQDPETSLKPIVLYDGICNLCGSVVLFIIRIDKNKQFRFYAFQSSIGMKIMNRSGLSTAKMESVILIRNRKIYKKSKAIFQILEDIGGFWKILLIFKIFPERMNNYLYDLIARKRYLIFGKKKECLIIK